MVDGVEPLLVEDGDPVGAAEPGIHQEHIDRVEEEGKARAIDRHADFALRKELVGLGLKREGLGVVVWDDELLFALEARE